MHHVPGIIFKAIIPDVLVRILPGTKTWSPPRRQIRISGISPLQLDRTARGGYCSSGSMCFTLLQMIKEVASLLPGLAVHRTPTKLARVSPYASYKERKKLFNGLSGLS
jgi:hypothetical protein